MDKEKLINDVRGKCYITDSSPEISSRLKMLIEDAIVKLGEQIGAPKEFDYSKAGLEHDLFINYCFYSWNDKANEFLPNYLNDVLLVRHKFEVINHEKQE